MKEISEDKKSLDGKFNFQKNRLENIETLDPAVRYNLIWMLTMCQRFAMKIADIEARVEDLEQSLNDPETEEGR